MHLFLCVCVCVCVLAVGDGLEDGPGCSSGCAGCGDGPALDVAAGVLYLSILCARGGGEEHRPCWT